MYYQLNNFTQRLIGTHGTTPYYPISAVPLNKNDSPKIIFDSVNVKIAQETVPARKMSSSKTIPGTKQQYGPVPQSIRSKMERFQIADGVPVHLKGGPFDKVLFVVTVSLCFIGVGLSANLFYGMSYPKKA